VDARTLTRLAFGLFVVALVTGCPPRRGEPLIPLLQSVPTNATPIDTTAPSDSIPGGTVVAAGGSGAPQPTQPTNPTVQPMPPPGALATPRPLPPTPNGPTDSPQSPVMLPPAVPQAPGAHPLRPNANTDPHIRSGPTAAGGRLGLAPYEVPTDRVVELTLHLERLLAQNRDLSAQIKELETAAAAREQVLEEAKREVDSLTIEAARTRAALQAQITTLQGKIKQLEEEDVIFLRAVIDALSKLFPEKRP
jgi:hypothetical protein